MDGPVRRCDGWRGHKQSLQTVIGSVFFCWSTKIINLVLSDERVYKGSDLLKSLNGMREVSYKIFRVYENDNLDERCFACLMLLVLLCVHCCRVTSLHQIRRMGSSSLLILKASPSDAGVYTCRASNTQDSVDSSTTIQVKGQSCIYSLIRPSLWKFRRGRGIKIMACCLQKLALCVLVRSSGHSW